MSWSEICGHERQKEFFERVVLSGRIAHAYLFSGPPRVGKTAFALELTKLLHCLNPARNGSCGQCKNCQLITNLTHPDVSLLSPLGDCLRIDEIRSFVRWLNFKPIMGKMKVGIIEEAEKLNEEAANCLLKTLEEPPKDTVVILITSHRASLLPTIISRCQIIEFSLLSPLEISNYLIERKGWKEEEAKRVSSLSQGSLGRAEEIKESRDDLEDKFRELWHKLKNETNSLSLGSWFYNNKEQLPLIMTVLEQYLRDLWIWKMTDGQCANLLFFERERVQKEAKEQETETWRRLIILVDNLVYDISGNLNWDIVLSRFIFLWRGEWSHASGSGN
ncbi:MAG TPA: DNA polymerase III subunit delta' [Candidatus Atribacteria bacterium]|nr:DNA polymerase III subunit delta' [Candidatus Atribacteria bacterium]